MNRIDPLTAKSPPRAPTPEGDIKLGWRLFKGFSGLLLIAIMVGTGHWLLRLESLYLPVRVVSVEGEVRQLPLPLLQDTVGRTLKAGILTQDLAVIQAAVEDLAWVSSAGVRRVWPDRVMISVKEHKPLARWGDDGLVTATGAVFRPGPDEIPRGLPRLDGPDDQAPMVVQRFLAWQPLFKNHGLTIIALEDDPRGAWTLKTDAGFTLLLGKAEVDPRLERFLRAYPEILAAGRPARIDMRYSNGLAVSWSGTRVANQDSPPLEEIAQAVTPSGPQGTISGPLPDSYHEPSAPDRRPSRS